MIPLIIESLRPHGDTVLKRLNGIELLEVKSYKKAVFWDNLDMEDFMEDDGEWFHFFDFARVERRPRGKRGDENGYADDRIPSLGCNPPGITPADSDTATLKDRRRGNGI
ncbi:MAG: hypothetical protein FJ011_17520 [Chloroflexi bacterium]|nr:hypothetical protein [Chloroflexota bacterium]